MGELQYVNEEIKEVMIEKCMVEGYPLIVIQGCLEKQERLEQFITPFNEAHKIRNRKVK